MIKNIKKKLSVLAIALGFMVPLASNAYYGSESQLSADQELALIGMRMILNSQNMLELIERAQFEDPVKIASEMYLEYLEDEVSGMQPCEANCDECITQEVKKLVLNNYLRVARGALNGMPLKQTTIFDSPESVKAIVKVLVKIYSNSLSPEFMTLQVSDPSFVQEFVIIKMQEYLHKAIDDIPFCIDDSHECISNDLQKVLLKKTLEDLDQY